MDPGRTDPDTPQTTEHNASKQKPTHLDCNNLLRHDRFRRLWDTYRSRVEAGHLTATPYNGRLFRQTCFLNAELAHHGNAASPPTNRRVLFLVHLDVLQVVHRDLAGKDIRRSRRWGPALAGDGRKGDPRTGRCVRRVREWVDSRKRIDGRNRARPAKKHHGTGVREPVRVNELIFCCIAVTFLKDDRART